MADLSEFDFKTKPYRHQLKELLELSDEPARALLWQMRSGKSKTMIDLACRLYRRGVIDAVILAAPNNVHLNWLVRELPFHHWDSVPRMTMAWESQKSRNVGFDARFKELAQFKGLAWLAVNHEAFANDRAKGHISHFVKHRRFLLVVDEVHEFRRPGSKRFRALKAVSKRSAVRRILSGTSTDDSPLHAYAEYELLADGALGQSTYEDFKAEYSVEEDIWVPGGFTKGGVKKSPRKQRAVVGYKNQERLREQIAQWSSLVLRSECDDMPDLIRTPVYFELHPEQKRLHNDLVRGTLARLDGGELIEPAEGGILVIRLQQIASGFVVDADGMVHDVVPPEESPRLQALLSQVALIGPKCVVWCRFREDIVRVKAALRAKGFQAVDYYGGTKPKDRLSHERRFREDPACGPLVGQPQAGGQGLDFSAATDIIWYSHIQDRIRRSQADERATKVGGRKIGVADLIAYGSNDERMLATLEEKGVRSDFLTGQGLREYLQLVR